MKTSLIITVLLGYTCIGYSEAWLMNINRQVDDLLYDLNSKATSAPVHIGDFSIAEVKFHNVTIKDLSTLRRSDVAWAKINGNQALVNTDISLGTLVISVESMLIDGNSVPIEFHVGGNAALVEAVITNFTTPERCQYKYTNIDFNYFSNVKTRSPIDKYNNLNLTKLFRDFMRYYFNNLIKEKHVLDLLQSIEPLCRINLFITY
ncbi:hypothetical protein O3M35_000146 [Rhynocoris fuscipes]|uniref:Uncharacterized protein n=1 Tax=Rhynocoris fuscipes TaxID=488301 RepID=A0AAW1DKE4_9HEMI